MQNKHIIFLGSDSAENRVLFQILQPKFPNLVNGLSENQSTDECSKTIRNIKENIDNCLFILAPNIDKKLLLNELEDKINIFNFEDINKNK